MSSKKDPFAGSRPPCPGALEPHDFLPRLQGLAGAQARKTASFEGYGGEPGGGRGQQFVGYRPYRVGEDARALDFLLLARLGKPFVRVQRSEARQQLCFLVDTSDSMAVGPPGKWQAAAEVVAAWAHVAGLAGAHVSVVYGEQGREPKVLECHRTGQWKEFSGSLFRLRASSGLGLKELLEWNGLKRRWSQVICVGDLFDVRPRDLQPHLRGSVPWTLVRILAPLENMPDPQAEVLWRDPEAQRSGRVSGGQAGYWTYMQNLAVDQKRWQDWAGAHRVSLRNHLSSHPFEQVFLGAGRGTSGVL